jgi:REP element-mobilizing transposase RayT
MTRALRRDTRGSWQHVYQRGASKRTVFEDREDARYFLAQVARAVHRGEVEIHAYCLLTTHFHMLASSPIGQLSTAMRRILNAYVRYFNRKRRRDGSLFHNRFKSKRADCLAYRRILVAHIDNNPVNARLVTTPQHHPWCSAHYYAQSDGPVWLTRTWIESEVRQLSGKTTYDPSDYPACFRRKITDAVGRWIEQRLHHPENEGEGDLENMLTAAPAEVRAWMQRKAHLADGATVGHGLVPKEWVEGHLGMEALRQGSWLIRRGTIAAYRSAWDLALPGLLRDLSGLSFSEISRRLATPRSTIAERVYAHHHAILSDKQYASRCAAIARKLLDRLRDL